MKFARVTIHEVRLSFPEVVSGTVDAVTVDPEFLPPPPSASPGTENAFQRHNS